MAVRDVSALPLADLVSLDGRNAVVTGAAWGLGRATAFRLAEAGDIRVMAVAPGVCLTEKTAFLADMRAEELKAIGIPGIDTSRLGRVGTADDVARVILFCASDMAMFMTGCTLVVDGGIAA